MFEIWEVRYTFRDEKRQSSITTLYLPTTVPFDAVHGFADEMIDLLVPMIHGALEGASISWIYRQPSYPDLGADVEEQARFDFLTSDESDADDHRMSISIPTVKDTIFTSRGDIDTANADVAAFIAGMLDGILVGEALVKPCDGRGEPLILFYGGGEEWRPRKRKKRRWLP